MSLPLIRLEKTLNQIIDHPPFHARWLNTLSYLEWRGFRKIARSQGSSQIKDSILLHLAEEARHALFFKHQAIQNGGSTFNTYSNEALLSKRAVQKYLWDLDLKLQSLLSSHQTTSLSYWTMTWVLEKRALWLYAIYDEQLRQKKSNFSLSLLIQEEQAHLKEMEKSFSKNHISKTLLSTCEKEEQTCFLEWWTSLERLLQKSLEGKR